MSIRLYQQSPLALNALITLTPENSHHLMTVLRARVGDAVTLFNGDGTEYQGVVVHLQKKTVQVELQQVTHPDRESSLSLHLAQGLCRGEKMDWVIQKSVELGVTEITPLFTEWSNVKLDTERLDKKHQHWQQVIISACEQSGRTRIPQLHPVQSLPTWIQQPRSGLKYLLHPQLSASTPQLPTTQPSSVMLMVGPEGGFSPIEVTIAQQHQFQSVQLGQRILRTETAPIAALSWIQTLWGDFPKLFT